MSASIQSTPRPEAHAPAYVRRPGPTLRRRLTAAGRALALAAVMAGATAACDDTLDTAPEAQPVTSADTLDLGFVLAGNSTPTYLLKLYNRGSHELRLTSITLREGTESGFRMNVDGMNGAAFVEPDLLRIAGGDSLFVFVEATFPRSAAGSASAGIAAPGALSSHEAHIDIACNGRQQSVALTATSREVATLTAATLTADTHWPAGTEVQIYDSLVVGPGVTLTVGDSSTLYLHDKADIIVHGTLALAGTTGRPVTLRGDRTDRMFDNLPYDNLPSQWGALTFGPTSAGNELTCADIHGMADGITLSRDATEPDVAQATFTRCRIANSGAALITATRSTLRIDNCLLTNAAGALVEVYGGATDITCSTLANYHFAAAITQEAFVLHDHTDTDLGGIAPVRHDMPVSHCTLTNTLIWGRAFNPDVRLDVEGTPTYLFDHCLLRADGTDDDQFVATVWGEDPLFALIDPGNYTYDLHLTAESPAIGAGIACDATVDLDGHERPAPPSIGCYEWVPAETGTTE